MNSSPRVLVILAPGFEEIEAITVIDILRRAEIEVVAAGTVTGPITAARGTRHLADAELGEVADQEFALIILPGGNDGTDHLRDDPRVKALLIRQREEGRWVAAICAAPTILVAHDWLQGEKLTCHPSRQKELPPAQLQADARVVRDGRLITSQAAGSAMEFAFALVAHLRGIDAARRVNQGVVAPALLLETAQALR